MLYGKSLLAFCLVTGCAQTVREVPAQRAATPAANVDHSRAFDVGSSLGPPNARGLSLRRVDREPRSQPPLALFSR